MTDGEGLINFLLNRQDGLLNYDDCSISFLKNQILVVKDKSEYLGSFLADIVQYRDMHQELNDLVRRVQDINYICFFHVKGYRRPGITCYISLMSSNCLESLDEHDEVYGLITSVTEMAYKAEYVIDSCLACSHPLCPQVKKTTDLAPSLSTSSPISNEEAEGFQEAMDKIKEQLLGGSPQLDVISLVGMPGIDARNGSRVILTTQLSDVANYDKSESNPHHLRLFTDGESWRLLQEEVFQEESCPSELRDVGFRLAKICGGLPLFIVLVAGFVQASEDAVHLLEDLISRNLVMGMKKRPNGKVKLCRIHDMLHQFCLEKAKQENFLLRINRFSEEDIFPEKPEEYRLFVHSSQDQIDLWQPSRSNVRSLIFNVIDLDNLLWPRDISFIFDSFKLVKLLDLESFKIGGTLPSEIQSLIHVRYFAAQTDKLWKLETFVVRGLGGEVILHSSILKMVNLRHILVKHRASFSLQENKGESLANSELNNLETFSTPRLSYGEDAETILKKMPNLRKLSCIFSRALGYSEEVKGRCVLFPRLEFLSHLEYLKLVSNSYLAKLPHVFSFPLRLRELTLSKFHLPWNQISTIAEFPNLEILKLLLRAFEGDEWEVKDSEFPELKYLELDDLNIAQWSVSDDALDQTQ
ncbi:hypothetical protein HAX54_019213 [Datura stramonium]|uniref:NB-ARC domain-containing protein n=1 Tax=Datura stramonium TaxID=4076 RepID=A0ABS8UQX4_DATST|nr:hypothetical protein [Datura stramonium]